MLYIMKKIKILQEKYILASSISFIGSLYLPWTSLHLLTGGSLVYNILDRVGLIEVSFHPDTAQRKLRLSEWFLFRLLRHHMLKDHHLSRWITNQTLMIAKPITKFEDQGFQGWATNKIGYKMFEKQQFTMEVAWKDVKCCGEGMAFCTGYYVDLQNYYFSKILLQIIQPQKLDLVILDTNSIDI